MIVTQIEVIDAWTLDQGDERDLIVEHVQRKLWDEYWRCVSSLKWEIMTHPKFTVLETNWGVEFKLEGKYW